MKLFSELKNNWKSGISVALVSVPLSFSLAIASGASPMVGIITAVWAGLVAGLVGGSRFNIVGPAGALSGILIAYALTYGAGILPLLAVGSGIIILIIWLLKWDKYLIFVPSSVVHGFTLGVALTIAFGQLNAALGLAGLPAHPTLVGNILESFRHISNISWSAFIPFLIGLALMYTIVKYKPLWPNSIIVAILGIFFGYGAVHGYIHMTFQTIGSKYPGLSNSLFIFPRIPTSLSELTIIFKASLVIGFVAVLETLISAKVADGMTKTKFRQRREVLGVGLANIMSGLAGGLPASGVFARTALNVRSGATSNVSQIINAIVVASLSVIFISSFSYLPLSITASILVYIASRMITVGLFKKLYRFDKTTFGLALVVAGLTFVIDATTGILVGALVSLLLFAYKLSIADLGSATDPENFNPEIPQDKAIVYRFAGALTYLTSKSHIERIHTLEVDKPLILNFRHINYIDVDGFEALDEMLETLITRSKEVFIAGVRPEMLGSFNHHEWFRKLADENKVVASTDTALSQI